MKILLIRFASLGDLVLTLPALRDLGESVDGEIHFLVREDFADLLAPLPGIQRIWTLPKGSGAAELKALAAALDAEGFDRVFDLHNNLRSRILRRALRRSRPAWHAVPRADLRRRLMLSRPVWPAAWRPRRALAPVRERHRDLLRRVLGADYRRAAERLYDPGEESRTATDQALDQLGLDPAARPLGLAPAAAWPAKIWPHFGALIERLDSRDELLVFGGPDEESACLELVRGHRARAFCGARPLPQVAAALSRCRALITGDTGLGHLAEAVGVPVLALFGPTVPAFGFPPWRPESRVLERPLACRPCSLHGEKPCRYGHRDCLAGLAPEAVLAALSAMGVYEP